MNNHFFSVCETTPNATQNEKYHCCIRTCTSQSQQPNVCYPMCAQVFPLIKDFCAFKENCWNNGFYDPKCIRSRQREIHQCCLNECGQYKYNSYSSDQMDCDQYCSEYVLHS
jgi:hypothetical protein